MKCPNRRYRGIRTKCPGSKTSAAASSLLPGYVRKSQTLLHLDQYLNTARKRIERELAAQLRTAQGKPCVVCAKPATAAHIWILDPRMSQEHMADPKKLRVYAYAVCDEHDVDKLVLPESKNVVQRKIHDIIVARLKSKPVAAQ